MVNIFWLLLISERSEYSIITEPLSWVSVEDFILVKDLGPGIDWVVLVVTPLVATIPVNWEPSPIKEPLKVDPVTFVKIATDAVIIVLLPETSTPFKYAIFL